MHNLLGRYAPLLAALCHNRCPWLAACPFALCALAAVVSAFCGTPLQLLTALQQLWCALHAVSSVVTHVLLSRATPVETVGSHAVQRRLHTNRCHACTSCILRHPIHPAATLLPDKQNRHDGFSPPCTIDTVLPASCGAAPATCSCFWTQRLSSVVTPDHRGTVILLLRTEAAAHRGTMGTLNPNCLLQGTSGVTCAPA